jgi:photosystem II stability/assembly factor-like uncharacterized protein
MKSINIFVSCTLLAASIGTFARAQSSWMPYGPDGGDARSFASDPSDHNHIYLGTVSGTIFDTHDGGQTWKRLASVGRRDDLVLDNILVDPANPKHVLIGGWVLDRPEGGLYVTNDGGQTWTENTQMKGHSIRALSIAPSDSKTMILGALDGVYRSTDSGNTWARITPAGSTELHEIESVAIDPKNPEIIYAGTWHLPWKTVDGGAHWTNITHEQGLIDDSDVFSIIVDPSNAQNVYLSACSGIYRSTDQAGHFAKVNGMPFSARRTRVLMEDSKQTNTVFAGTTEGLWRTTDSGHTFLRSGDPSWIINDVIIDSTDSKHVLLATDRTGVLMSNDGGLTFAPANKGFASRQISAIAQDKSNPERMWVSVINDKTAGGVFASEDAGITWTQQSAGLGEADIFSLAQAPDGTLLAGSRHGIFRLTGGVWKNSGLTLALPPEVDPNAVQAKRVAARGARAAAAARAANGPHPAVAGKRAASVGTGPARNTPPQQSTTGVYAMVATDKAVFAATEEGLLTSTDNGNTWNHIRSTHGKAWHQVSAQGTRVLIADQHGLSLSSDGGSVFQSIAPPPDLTFLTATTIDDGGRLWVGGREGIYYSDNDGAAWKSQTGLFVPNISGLFFDRTSRRVFVTANFPNTMVFSVHTQDMKVTYSDSGWALRTVRPVGDRLVGVTPYEGVVLQPKMVVSELKNFK